MHVNELCVGHLHHLLHLARLRVGDDTSHFLDTHQLHLGALDILAQICNTPFQLLKQDTGI
jgi:hypothetical protein